MWTRLDDSFYDNPKVLRAGDAAVGLYVKMLSWCGRHLTDGFVEEAALVRLTPHPKLVGQLLNVGLVRKVDGGYQIPDFPEFNPTREDIKRRQEADRVRKASKRNPHGQPTESARSPAPARALPDPPARNDPKESLPAASNPEPARGGMRSRTSEAVPSPKARRILDAWLSLSGRGQFSQTEVMLAEELAAEFQALSGDRAAERMYEHWASCQSNGWTKPKTLRGFTQTLRLENDHQSDRRSTGGRAASGLSRIEVQLP